MTGSGANRGVPEAVAHGRQTTDVRVDVVRTPRQHGSIDARLSVVREHASDLLQREARAAAERDEGQAFVHAGIEGASQSTTPNRRDQALRFVMAQRRRRQPGALREGRDVHDVLPLDLKST